MQIRVYIDIYTILKDHSKHHSSIYHKDDVHNNCTFKFYRTLYTENVMVFYSSAFRFPESCALGVFISSPPIHLLRFFTSFSEIQQTASGNIF